MDQPNVAKFSAGSKALLSWAASKVFPKLRLATVGQRAAVEVAPTLCGGAARVKGCDVGTTYHFGAAAPSKQLAAERAKFAGGTAPYYYPDSAEARARATVEEFGASAMVQSVRKEGPSGLKSKFVRQSTPLTPPQNDRYEDIVGCVRITGGAGGLGRLQTDYL